MTTIAVVGSTGQVGGEVARLLLARGVGVRALGRNPEKLKSLAALGAEPHAPDCHDASALAQVFRHADGVFVMIPPGYDHPDPRTHQRETADAIAAALQVARTRHAVTLSSLGVEQPEGTGPILGLRAMEERLNRVPGLNLVHLRTGFFFENFLAGIGQIRAAGVHGGLIAPEVKIAMVASRDIGALAADLLAAPTFTGQRVREVHGQRRYTMPEATRILGAAIGQPDLAYVQLSEPDTLKGLLMAGLSRAMADLYVELFTALNRGLVRPLEPRPPSTVAPTSLEQFAGEVFAPAFRQ
jgi:uncharacterized protein YbjT (DUF2867 family)